MNQRLLLGVDGGGSHTKAWLAELVLPGSEVRILGRAQGAPANVRAVGLDSAIRAVLSTVQAAFAEAGIAPMPVDAACISLAGAGRREEQIEVRKRLESTLAHRVLAVPDFEILLAAAEDLGQPADRQQAGIALIAGTGSIAWGRSTLGQTARSGGWGHFLGDEGSGFALAQSALRLACATADGRAREDAWLAALLEHLGLKQPADLIAWCYTDASSAKARIATLCPLVFECQPDSPALQQIVARGAQALAELAVSTARALDLAPGQVQLVAGGSVICKQASYQDALSAAFQGQAWHPGSIAYVDQAAAGAIRLAHAFALQANS